MKKLMLVATLLVAGASVPFAQDTMDNNNYNSDNNYSYGNHMNGNRGNHMNSGSDRGHGNRMGRGHMNSDRNSGSHTRSGDCCGNGSRNGGSHMNSGRHSSRGSSYNSQMPVAVQQQIQAVEQKYEVQRLAIDQKYDAQNIAFSAQYDKLYNTMGNVDMRPMNNILTPEQAQFMLQMDELDAQRNQVREEKRNEIRTLENQTSDAIDSITQKWLSSIK